MSSTNGLSDAPVKCAVFDYGTKAFLMSKEGKKVYVTSSTTTFDGKANVRLSTRSKTFYINTHLAPKSGSTTPTKVAAPEVKVAERLSTCKVRNAQDKCREGREAFDKCFKELTKHGAIFDKIAEEMGFSFKKIYQDMTSKCMKAIDRIEKALPVQVPFTAPIPAAKIAAVAPEDCDDKRPEDCEDRPCDEYEDVPVNVTPMDEALQALARATRYIKGSDDIIKETREKLCGDFNPHENKPQPEEEVIVQSMVNDDDDGLQPEERITETALEVIEPGTSAYGECIFNMFINHYQQKCDLGLEDLLQEIPQLAYTKKSLYVYSRQSIYFHEGYITGIIDTTTEITRKHLRYLNSQTGIMDALMKYVSKKTAIDILKKSYTKEHFLNHVCYEYVESVKPHADEGHVDHIMEDIRGWLTLDEDNSYYGSDTKRLILGQYERLAYILNNPTPVIERQFKANAERPGGVNIRTLATLFAPRIIGK